VTTADLPSLDLVVATVDRVDELGHLLDSLERQTHRGFRLLVVDQNGDDRLGEVLGAHASLDVVRLRSGRGLSRARNAALGDVSGSVVAFPDDDCTFPDDVLERVGRRFAAEPALDGLTGRAVDAAGQSGQSWSPNGAILTRDNLWNRAISFTIFLRAGVIARVGGFDERLGLGSGTPWSSGEEIDYLVRAIEHGARIEYDPSLVVVHGDKTPSGDALAAIGARDGGSVGYILRKHAYPLRTVARMLVRPAGGVLLALVRGDRTRMRFHAATLRGRLRGYSGARRSAKTSA
jgi:glycosyltransferase involved in cell wall biosynthesis